LDEGFDLQTKSGGYVNRITEHGMLKIPVFSIASIIII
jgi:hypothetical protein